MRFDDSLATVLAANADSGFGAEAAWRQLVDLVGRGRVPDVDAAIERLRGLRDEVAPRVRAASGRALAWIEPPAALVAFFAEDEVAAAAPVLRAAQLDEGAWLALLPRLTPTARAVLRHRRDLPEAVGRGLASFGATDFVLAHTGAEDATAPEEVALASLPPVQATPAAQSPATPFVAVGAVARALPVVEQAMRHAETPRFEIADLVARIDAFRREQPAPEPARPAPPADRFDFHTDAAGVIRWVEGVARGPLVGLNLALGGTQGAATMAADVARAFQARAAFRELRVEIGGGSSAAGRWLLAGTPRFDTATGGFTGMAGTARRPRAVTPAPVDTAADTLRQLVHELRTPANAIAGFSELIGTELLGPVPPVYRERAQLIGREAAALAGAIDDLDVAARIEAGALDVRPDTIDLVPVLGHVVDALRPLAAEHGVDLVLDAGTEAHARVDAHEVGRLLDRLLVAVLTAADPGERVRVQLVPKSRSVRVHVSRPRALIAGPEEELLGSTPIGEGEGGLLLGIGFTLGLARALAVALGGSLQMSPDRLTLRLPAVETASMERATAQ